MSITEIIAPIKLLSGSHADTAETGQGCFMNVVAYLNGEAQITDRSTCVCYVMTPLLIYANDFMDDEDRHLLIPFIVRAMGSRTDDRLEISRRLKLVVAFAESQSEAANYAAKYTKSDICAAKADEYAAKSAKYASKYAAKCSAEHAKCAAEHAKYAAQYAKYAAEYTEYDQYAEYRKIQTKLLLNLFDAALPVAKETDEEVIVRAKNIVAMAA